MGDDGESLTESEMGHDGGAVGCHDGFGVGSVIFGGGGGRFAGLAVTSDVDADYCELGDELRGDEVPDVVGLGEALGVFPVSALDL